MFCPSLWLKRSFVLSDALCGCSAVGRERAVGRSSHVLVLYRDLQLRRLRLLPGLPVLGARLPSQSGEQRRIFPTATAWLPRHGGQTGVPGGIGLWPRTVARLGF